MKIIRTILGCIAVAVIALSCQKTKIVIPEVSLSECTAFNDNNKAFVTVTLSKAAATPVQVYVGLKNDTPGFKDVLTFSDVATVEAGKTMALIEVVAEPATLEPGTYEADVFIREAAGANISASASSVKLSLVIENKNYNDDPNNPSNPEDPENPGNTNWKIEYQGYQMVDFGDEEDYAEVFRVTGTGSESAYFVMVEPGTVASYANNMDELFAQAEEWLQEDLEFYSQYSWTIDDLVFTEDPHYEYYAAFSAGEKEVIVFGMSKEGKASGKYAYLDFTVAEDHGESEEPEEPDIMDRIAVEGTGNKLFTFDLLEHGVITDANLEDSIMEVGEYPSYIAWLYNSFFGGNYFDFTDFANDAEYNTTDFYAKELGTYDVLIVGLDDDGNLSGEYNISTIEIDGHELAEVLSVSARSRVAANRTVRSVNHGRLRHHVARRTVRPRIEPEEMVLQSNWTITIDGEPYTDEEGYYVIDVNVSLPGIKYYFAEENSDEDIDYYYDGSIAGFANYMEDELSDYLGSYTMDDLAYTEADPIPNVYIYNDGVETTIYVVEFDENGKATGRYGAGVVQMPAIEGEGEYEGVTITGPLTKMNAWTAAYLGRFEEAAEENAPSATRRIKVSARIRR